MPNDQGVPRRGTPWYLTGKTHFVIEQFIKACRKYGPKNVAAVTYTKSAADELRTRAAAALGISGNPDVLKREIPWVGTVHSIGFKLAGLRPDQIVDSKNIKEFCTYVGSKDVPNLSFNPDEMEDGSWSQNISDLAIILKAHAAARNRGTPIRDVLADLVLPSQQLAFPAAHVEQVARKYEEWKRDTKHYDYEDMLIVGRERPLPVKVLIYDEAQDGSPLMWSVIDRWAEGALVMIASGDPYQAIFGFMGAVPEVFMNHPGKWIPLLQSYRVDNATAEYSREILRLGGWDPKTLWEGIGGEARDGTKMYLGRTHNMVHRIERELMDKGEPFTSIKGYSLWNSPTAEAYRILAKLKRRQMISTTQLATLAKGAAPWSFGSGTKATIEKLAKTDQPMDSDDAERVLGVDLYRIHLRSKEIQEYLERVETKHRFGGLFLPPKIRVGTVHASKGREADEVTLVSDWDFLPSKVASTPGDGAKREACVAYVASTRHRTKLILEEKGWSNTYTFPRRRRE